MKFIFVVRVDFASFPRLFAGYGMKNVETLEILLILLILEYFYKQIGGKRLLKKMLKLFASDSPNYRTIGTVIAVFGIFLLCLIWTGLYYMLQSERQQAVKEASKETANLARAFEEHTFRTINSADQVALFLKYESEKEGLTLDIPHYVKEGRISGQPFVLLTIVNEKGESVASSQVPFVPANISDREHFLVHKNPASEKLFISKPVLGRTSGKWSIQMTRRINKPDGSFGGVVVVSLDPFYFSDFYNQVDLGQNSVIALVGSDGIVRARRSGQNTTVGQDLSNSTFASQLQFSNTGTYLSTSAIDGVKRLFSYRTLSDYPLTVLVGLDQDEIMANVNKRARNYYLVSGTITAVILGFILLLLKSAARQQVAEEALKQARDNLELQVEHRTQELYTANQELQKTNEDLESEIVERIEVEETLLQKEEDLRISKETLSIAAELAHLGPWKYDPETNLFEFGDEFYALFATSAAREGRFMVPEVYAKTFVHPDDAWLVAAEVQKSITFSGRHFSNYLEHRIIRRDGVVRTIAVRTNTFKDADGRIIKHYGANQDITERVLAENELRQQAATIRQMAYYDMLTGLPNRAHLSEWLSNKMERSRLGDYPGAVLFIDLDDLKMVNDTFGHSCGDEIIIAAGSRIVAEVGEEGFVARIGGDEFIVILPGITDRHQIDSIVHRIIRSLAQRHDVGGTHFHMTASIGIAVYPVDGVTAEEIIKNADNAMYAAKKDGKNCWRFYTSVMQTEAYDKMRLTNSLRYALERGEFSLHYQPQILAGTGSVVGFESLLRWHSNIHGSVPPARFIPLAEQSGLINHIGQWVLREACLFARRLTDNGHSEINVAVNISSKQLAADDFITLVRSAVEDAGIEPRQLELEITESVLMASLEDATSKLAELQAFGISLSLDDFGTGYSSLTYLRKLPVKTLKIDKSFIEMIANDPHVAKIIVSIINMAHTLDMSVVAEGVETEQQLIYLTGSGCDRIQGFIFSRPLPESEAIGLLD